MTTTKKKFREIEEWRILCFIFTKKLVCQEDMTVRKNED